MNAITKHDESAVQIADPMIGMIERMALMPDVPAERIQALMDMRERQMNKEAEQEFNRAFAAAMAEMPPVPRNGWNPHLKRKYSTVDDLIVTSRPVLARHGLSLNWQTGTEGDQIWVRAIVRHASGHQISTEERGSRDKSGSMNALQGGGSTQTYLKRYTGFAILGMASGDEQDDDGVTASEAAVTPAEIDAISRNIRSTRTKNEVTAYLQKLEKRFHVEAVKNIAKDHMAYLDGLKESSA